GLYELRIDRQSTRQVEAPLGVVHNVGLDDDVLRAVPSRSLRVLLVPGADGGTALIHVDGGRSPRGLHGERDPAVRHLFGHSSAGCSSLRSPTGPDASWSGRGPNFDDCASSTAL